MLARDEISNEILRRRDMRDAFTFTIDPADAKDFDDALSFECLAVAESDGLSEERSVRGAVCQAQPVYQVGVHIADVSHYVRPNQSTGVSPVDWRTNGGTA